MRNFFIFFSTAIFLFCNNLHAQVKPENIKVNFVTPKKLKVDNSLELPATINSNEEVNITSTVSEKITEILFKEGVLVKKNQVLVVLNNSEEKAILKQFKAELREAELNYERALSLSKNGNISQSILDSRFTEKNRLTGKVEEIKAKIEDMIIRAPFDGIIGIRNFSIGAFVRPGDIITTLYDLSTIKIEAYAPESYSQQIKIGDSVNIKINSVRKDIKGKISVIDPYIDKKTRTFKIISETKNNTNIKPGMMAKILISLENKDSTFIPESAIIPIDDETFVYLINNQNTIERVKVSIGSRSNGNVEILQGIKADDKIVYEGVNKIKQGTKVITK